MAEGVELAGAHGIADYVFASVFLALLVVLWRAHVKGQARAMSELKAVYREAAEERAAATERAAAERASADERIAAAREDFFLQLEKHNERHAETLRSITREFADATRTINERVMNAVINLQNLSDTLGRRVGRRSDGG